MVNGFRYYRALDIIELCLPLYPCQIRVRQRWQSKLQLPTSRKKEWRRPQRAVHPMPVNTVIHSTLVGLKPPTFRLLVDCWSNALPVVPPTHWCHWLTFAFAHGNSRSWEVSLLSWDTLGNFHSLRNFVPEISLLTGIKQWQILELTEDDARVMFGGLEQHPHWMCRGRDSTGGL